MRDHSLPHDITALIFFFFKSNKFQIASRQLQRALFLARRHRFVIDENFWKSYDYFCFRISSCDIVWADGTLRAVHIGTASNL